MHQKSLAECLQYEPRLIVGCLFEVWLPMLGISYRDLSREVRCNCIE